ncbi:hypothetical protein HDU79_007615 [Rhizoclosmatium sp. JEL0117]|nr:hypothetical protein HDU79_007615 [Rhizoclosmatium sp. JEL0117]
MATIAPEKKFDYVHDDNKLSATRLEGYDADLEYTEEEENQVRRRIDLRLMSWVLLSTFILNLNRASLSNAISDGLPKNLGFGLDVVNNGASLWAVVFAASAFCGSILGKRFGPHRFIPVSILIFGFILGSHAFITNSITFYIIRFVLATVMGGVIPATLVYLGGFYKKNELATRLSWFWGAQSLASAVSGLLAAFILQLKGKAGLYGWQWLFIIYGITTVTSAVFLYLAFPKSPYHTKGGLNGNGWLDDRQARIAITRLVRDDALKLHYNTQVTFRDVWATITDVKVLFHLAITFTALTPGVPFGLYLPTTISSFGFNVYVSNALTAPNYILTLISMIVMCAHSDRVNERGFHGALSLTWYFTGFALLAFLPDGTDKGIRYFATLVISSAPFTHPLNIAWLTENTAPIGKRTVASGAVICAANLYGTYAAQIYQPWDAPAYRVGNRIILGFIATAILLFLLRKYFYIQLNKQRAAIWNAKSEDEKAEYNATTKHVGNERLDFVFKN